MASQGLARFAKRPPTKSGGHHDAGAGLPNPDDNNNGRKVSFSEDTRSPTKSNEADESKSFTPVPSFGGGMNGGFGGGASSLKVPGGFGFAPSSSFGSFSSSTTVRRQKSLIPLYLSEPVIILTILCNLTFLFSRVQPNALDGNGENASGGGGGGGISLFQQRKKPTPSSEATALPPKTVTNNPSTELQAKSSSFSASGQGGIPMFSKKPTENTTQTSNYLAPPSTEAKTPPDYSTEPNVGTMTDTDYFGDVSLSQETVLTSNTHGTSAGTKLVTRPTTPSFLEEVTDNSKPTKTPLPPTTTNNLNGQGDTSRGGALLHKETQSQGLLQSGLQGSSIQPLGTTTPLVSATRTHAPFSSSMEGCVLHKKAKSSMSQAGKGADTLQDQDMTLEGIAEQGESFHTPCPFSRQVPSVERNKLHFGGTDAQVDRMEIDTTPAPLEQAYANLDARKQEESDTSDPFHTKDHPEMSNIVTPAGRMDSFTPDGEHTDDDNETKSSQADSPDWENMQEEFSQNLRDSSDILQSFKSDLLDGTQMLDFAQAELLNLLGDVLDNLTELEALEVAVADMAESYRS